MYEALFPLLWDGVMVRMKVGAIYVHLFIVEKIYEIFFCKSYTSATRLLKCFSFIRQKDPSHNLHCLGLFQTGQCLPDVLTSQAHHLKKRLDPIQIHCLKACTGVFRSSPSASLCRVELNPEREFHHYIMGTPSPASRSPRCWFQVIQVHSFIMMKKSSVPEETCSAFLEHK